MAGCCLKFSHTWSIMTKFQKYTLSGGVAGMALSFPLAILFDSTYIAGLSFSLSILSFAVFCISGILED